MSDPYVRAQNPEIPLPSLVANLQPGPETTSADVALAHAKLASAVVSGQAAGSIAGAALLDPQQLGSGPVSGGVSDSNRVFLAGLSATLFADGGVPDWAHGMVASAVTPTMLTVDGLPAQLHQINPLVQTTLVRAGDPEVLLSLDLPSSSVKGRSFPIGAGSIWFAAGLLIPAAAGGFAGLRVKGGTLTADADLTFAGLQALLPVDSTATIVLEVEQPATASAVVQFPHTFTIVLAPTGMSFSTGDPASVTAFGMNIQLTPATGTVSYDVLNRDLAVPLRPDATVFAPVASDSTVATPVGVASLTGAVWAIPVAFNSAASLGRAAGAGALRLLLGPGIALRSSSPDLKAPLRTASLSVGEGTVQLTGELAARVTARVFLWDETGNAVSPPRISSVLFTAEAGDRVLLTVTGGGGDVEFLGACAASIDRPVTSAGRRLRLTFPTALLAIRRTTIGTTGYVIANQANTKRDECFSLILENALLIVESAQSLVIAGPLAEGRVRSGVLRLALPLLDLVPTLPDPYAANTSTSTRERVDNMALDVITVAVEWSAGVAAALDIVSGGAGLSSGLEPQTALLMDVSTNLDLFGLAVMERKGVLIDASVLSATATSLALFTLPGVSWESVEVNDPTVGVIDPPPSDGVPNFVKVATARLVPLEPLPLLREYVDAVKAGARAEMKFMLPFGLLADATLPRRSVLAQGASFELVMPSFPQALAGGLQLTLRPPNPQSLTAGFPGSVRALKHSAEQVLGPVFGIFDGQFGPDGKHTIVPVRRVDLSGYGNSMFSDWLDIGTHPGVPAVAEARFDVIMARTSYEVVQVVSVIHPWGIEAVRSITLARQDGGRILRSDTGWVAFSEGNFDVLPSGAVAHKGPVARVSNVQNIQEQGPELPLDPNLDFRPVLFDADIVINPDLGVPDGGVTTTAGTTVPSHGLNGFMQIRPVNQFLTIGQLGNLMQGRVVGGTLACTVDLGGAGVPGPLFRVTGIRVSATGAPGALDLVVALLGTPRLPSNGSWSIGQLFPGGSPSALGPEDSVPLIRQNSSPDWHLADPSDINRLDAPLATRYGLLQATGTQRAFFQQPRIREGTSQINLGEPPHLADVASLLNATGVFPDLANALQFDQPPKISAVGDTLTVERHRFSLAGVPSRLLLGLPPVQVLLAYADADGQPAFADVEINPTGSPTWTIDVGTVSLLLVLPPFGTVDDPLLRLTGSIHADSLTAPGYKDLVVHFGGAMSLVEQVFTRLQELAKLLPGGKANLDVAFSDGRLTIRDSFTLPNLPLGLGQITDIGMDLGLTVSLPARTVDFQVGIASPDKPFHWLVSPLSGTGAVVVGWQDGRSTILVQGGLGVGLAIDVGIASGSASVVLALQVDNRVAPLELKIILTGHAAVDVLDGVASAALMLAAAMAIVPDKLPIPDEITLFAEVAVGIHLSLCWVASIDFDGSWHVQQTLTSPIS
jgi:hypothetical protein